MDAGKTNPREHVDNRKWARRHLQTAVAAEKIDETDYHISMARQLLVKTMTENTDTSSHGAPDDYAEPADS